MLSPSSSCCRSPGLLGLALGRRRGRAPSGPRAAALLPVAADRQRRRLSGRSAQTVIPASAEWRVGDGGELGVFAREPLAPGATVERCYALRLDATLVSEPEFKRWLYPALQSLPVSRYLILPLGWGMLYNEGRAPREPNVTWLMEEEAGPQGRAQFYMTLRTSRAVGAGEELLVQPRRPPQPGVGDGNCSGGGGGGPAPLRDVLTVAMLAASRRALGQRELPERPDIDGANADIGRGVLLPPGGVSVRRSPVHGNGVFAKRRFRRGATVEVAPNLLATSFLLATDLRDYVYHAFEPDNGILQVSLGYGSIYNHSDNPNLKYCMATSSKRLCAPAQRFSTRYYAARDVEIGEELTISYGAEWWPSRRE